MENPSLSNLIDSISELVNEIFQKHPDLVNAQDDHGNTALHLMVSEGNVEAVEWLLENGAYVNVLNRRNESPLDRARVGEAFSLLVAHGGVRANVPNHPIYRLHTSVTSNRIKNVENILRETNPPNIDLRAIPGSTTALQLASIIGNLDIVRLLLNNGADVNIKGPSDNTALHMIATSKHTEVIDILLQKGADQKAKNYLGKTPLELSTYLQKLNEKQFLKDISTSGPFQGTGEPEGTNAIPPRGT